MAEYYFIAQLPSLDCIDENAPLPITEERFLELAERFLGKKAWREVTCLTLAPAVSGEKSSSALVEAWNQGERKLRLALAVARASKRKKTFDVGDMILPLELIKIAKEAVEMSDPLEAEKYLGAYRLGFLEALRPADPFSEDFVFYYGLKLKLISRLKQFDAEVGSSAYRNIYSSIIGGDSLEVK